MDGFEAMEIKGMIIETPTVSTTDKRMVSPNNITRNILCFLVKRALSF
jgi:hypothetical protein